MSEPPDRFIDSHDKETPMDTVLTYAECNAKIDERLEYLRTHPTPLLPERRPGDRVTFDERVAYDSELHALQHALRHPHRAAPARSTFPAVFAEDISPAAHQLLELVDSTLGAATATKFADVDTRRRIAVAAAGQLKLDVNDVDVEAVAHARRKA
jgi:hypothetical protein